MECNVSLLDSLQRHPARMNRPSGSFGSACMVCQGALVDIAVCVLCIGCMHGSIVAAFLQIFRLWRWWQPWQREVKFMFQTACQLISKEKIRTNSISFLNPYWVIDQAPNHVREITVRLSYLFPISLVRKTLDPMISNLFSCRKPYPLLRLRVLQELP